MGAGVAIFSQQIISIIKERLAFVLKRINN
jgi:hypothetical protein